MDELATVCQKEQISLLPYSPIAGGVLTGKYSGPVFPPDARFGHYRNNPSPRVQKMADRFLNEKTLAATEKYMALAGELGMEVTTLAVAWSKQHPFVASTIIGARMSSQLDASLTAMDLNLSPETMEACRKIQQEILYPMG